MGLGLRGLLIVSISFVLAGCTGNSPEAPLVLKSNSSTTTTTLRRSTTTTTSQTTTTTTRIGSTTTTSSTTSTTQIVSTTTTTTTTSSTTTTTLVSSGSGYCSAGGNSETCREGNCGCFVQLAKAIHGSAIDMDFINNNGGGGDPATLFTSGGSENIPVTCRAAKYWKDGDPAWFIRYFDIQLTATSGAKLFGKEIFSSTYAALTAGVVIAVHQKALRMGHQNLLDKSSKWLRAYWSVMALAATQNPVRLRSAVNYNEATGFETVFSEPTPQALLGGYGVVLPGNRSYVNQGSGGVGLQYILMSMALSHPGRKYQWTLDQSPGYYGGLCAAVKSVGYSFNSEGKVNLASRTPAAEYFGLNEQERTTLSNFVLSNGQNGLSSVVQYLSGYELACDLTIIRTNQGITSWFGNETDTTGLCSRSKGGTFVAGTLNFSDNKTIYLSRATRQNNPEAASIWKEGAQICEETAQRAKKCIPMANGTTIYKIDWPKDRNISAY